MDIVDIGIGLFVLAVGALLVLNIRLLVAFRKAQADAADVRVKLLAQLRESKGSGADTQEITNSVQELRGQVKVVSQALTDVVKTIQGSANVGGAALKNIEGSVAGVRDYLAEKSKDYQRMQEGYDYTVLKNFCKQIIRCVHRIETLSVSANAGERKILDGIRVDLIDLLDRNGVVRFEPEIGTDYSELRSSAEVLAQKELTTDEAKVGCVAGVVRSGFHYIYNDDQMRLIMPAQVKIYAREAVKR